MKLNVDFQKQCDCYWPEKVGEEKKYGAANVKMEAEGHFADYTLRIFTLTAEVYFYLHGIYYCYSFINNFTLSYCSHYKII